jgi:hypothetical protein
MAILIPTKPASPEQMAPKIKAMDTCQPKAGTTARTIATITITIAIVRYSLPRNANAPSLMAEEISCTFLEPWGCFST